MRTGGCHSSVAEHKSAIGVQGSTPGVSQPFLFPLFSLHNIQNSLLYVTHHLCTCQNISMRIQQEIHQVISCCQHCMADLYGLIDSLNQRACKSAALTVTVDFLQTLLPQDPIGYHSISIPSLFRQFTSSGRI